MDQFVVVWPSATGLETELRVGACVSAPVPVHRVSSGPAAAAACCDGTGVAAVTAPDAPSPPAAGRSPVFM